MTAQSCRCRVHKTEVNYHPCTRRGLPNAQIIRQCLDLTRSPTYADAMHADFASTHLSKGILQATTKTLATPFKRHNIAALFTLGIDLLVLPGHKVRVLGAISRQHAAALAQGMRTPCGSLSRICNMYVPIR
jgi:hypothetical protein